MFTRLLFHTALAATLAACGSEEVFQLELGSTERPVSDVTIAKITSDNHWLQTLVDVGDIDGDGITDAVVVAIADDNTIRPNLVSEAHVLYGGPAVTGSISVDSLPRLKDLDIFPQIIPVGDVDGDGLADFLVVVYTLDVADWQDRPTPHGTYLVYGRATRLSGDSSVRDVGVLLGGTPSEVYPTVTGLGDLDGDGLDDFAIGSWPGGLEDGTAYLFYGRAERFSGTVDVPTAADAAIALPYGRQLTRLGDVDGDGRPDFLAGGSLVRGRSSRLAGAVALGDITATQFTSALPGVASTGQAVALGDLDGDGLDDFAVYSQASPGTRQWTNSYEVYYGRAGGFPASVDASGAAATVTNSGLLYVTAIDDGKGHRDLVVGEPERHDDNGAVHVVHTAGARLAGAVDLSRSATYVGVPRHAANCDFATSPGCSVHEGLGGSVMSAAITGGGRANLIAGDTASLDAELSIPGSSWATLYVLSPP
jgi:hypothetical protein